MAGEEGVWRVPWLGRLSGEGLREYADLHRQGLTTLALTLGVFVVTLAVYYLTAFHYEGTSISLTDAFLDGPSQAPHNHPVRLADAFLHGRLDVANGKDLLGFLDFACEPYPCSAESKYYPLEPPGTALVILPGVALFGLSINQTLVSLVVGALAATLVFHVARRLTGRLWEQLGLTAMFVFGTVYWWNSVYGGVWYFNHAVAAFFLFAAVYETLVGKRPLSAGLCLGAAYITRLPAVWTFPFFAIMFTDWEEVRELGSCARRVLGGSREEARILARHVRSLSPPVLKFGAGLAVFVVGFAILNYSRFDTISPQATYDHWHAKAQLSAPGQMLEHGLVSVKHISRHAPIFFEKPFYMQSAAPYVLPSWNGAAFWATTPAFLYAFLAAFKDRRLRLAAGAALALAIGVLFILPNLGRGGTSLPWFDWAQWDLPRLVKLSPFFALAGLSIALAMRSGNKLVVACWAGIIPVIVVHHLAASTGWPQFGYRYLLDYAPLAFLLTWEGMGRRLSWLALALIGAGIVINLCGVLWTNKFDTNTVGGVRWVSW